MSTETIIQEVDHWLNQVVIGLNLCPFAAKPQRNQQIKIYVSEASDEEALLQDIYDQLLELDTKEPQKLETTLVVVPNLLHDFVDYNFLHRLGGSINSPARLGRCVSSRDVPS